MKSPACNSRSTRANRRTVTATSSNTTTTTNAPPPPDQHLQPHREQEQGGLEVSLGGAWSSNDESFSGEERFLPLIEGESPSWEDTQSLGDLNCGEDIRAGGRPSSSSQDRRKQFDSTTPTLVDEDEEEHQGADEEVEYEFEPSLHPFSRGEADVMSSGVSATLRRTPGASQMHQSATGTSDSSGISFGGTLGEGSSSQKWSYLPRQGGEEPSVRTEQPQPPLALGERSEGVQLMRGPFVFTPWAKNNQSLSASSSSEARFSPNILRLTEDIGNLLHEDEDDDTIAIEIPSVFRGSGFGNRGGDQLAGGSQGGIMGAGSTEIGSDWTGSYVFDHQSHNRIRRGGTVQRPGNVIKETKPRRRSNHQYHGHPQAGFAQQQYQPSGVGPSPFLFSPLQFQQHKPIPQRHDGETGHPQHQVFEFGKQQQHCGCERCERCERGAPSPQLLNFGVGAFVPPPQLQQQQQSKDASPYKHSEGRYPNFMRPVPTSPSAPFLPHPFPQQHPPPQMEGQPMFGIPPPSFQSFEMRPQLPPGVFHPVPHFGLPHPPPEYREGHGPPMMAPSLHQQQQPGIQFQGQQEQQRQQQLSDMDVRAQEFIPMTTRGSEPFRSFMPPHQLQPQWQPPQMAFDHPPPPMMEPLDWFSDPPTASNYQMGPVIPASGYNMPSSGYRGGDSYGVGDAVRAQMTPSPHFPTWPQQHHQAPVADSSRHTAPPPPSTPVEVAPVPLPAVATPAPSSVATTPVQVPPPSPDVSSQGNRNKKDSRRNTRARKKKTRTPEKGATSPAAGTGTIVKKRGKGDVQRVASLVSQEASAPDEGGVSASEDPADMKKAELEESPDTRIAFKDFYRAFRGEEKHSFQNAEKLAQQALEDGSLPESVHWKVYLELADLAKRSNRYAEARRLYQKVCQLQPFASQGWLEYSKLEEDCGCMNRVSNILHKGLEYCEYSETLLTRAVKHQERMGNLSVARGILARLKHVGIDKVWRTVLEGALLEARAGNHEMARRVLKYLMHHVPWYGPLYLEAYKLERDQGHPMDAMHIVERGLNTLPRYGPLWFGAFRLYEEMDVTEGQFHLPRTLTMIERAKSTISKELVWKLHLEAAQMLERTALAYVEESGLDLESYLSPVRRRLVLTILTCPQNLRWKVWLAAGRMELVIGNVDVSHSLFRRAHHCVQQKSKSATMVDCARLAEFKGDVELARGILTKARSFYGGDWKVWFESVLVEIRNDNHARGYEIAANGLEFHTGSGRLWATLVQLGQLVGGDEMQTVALERALSAVPKSGEVWCEGARIHLNPFSCTFDLHRSRRYLYFAARFTPQFGDSFIESIRLEVLSQWLYPIAKFIWKKTKRSLKTKYTDGNIAEFVSDVGFAIAMARSQASDQPTKFRDIVSTLRKKLNLDNLRSSIDLTDLRLSCSNADPNYGSLWFHCRKLPTYTPRRVIEHAAEDIAEQVFKYADIYLFAMIRRMIVLAAVDQEMPEGAEGSIETSDPGIINWENYIDCKLREAISLQNILNSVEPPTGLALLESAMGGSIFITGLSELNSQRPLQSMTFLERRRALFGTDALFP